MTELVFAKKCVLPIGAANVLQSLHMAAAFREAGAKTYFFPGVRGENAGKRREVFEAELSGMGIGGECAASWPTLPGNHAGLYGLRFRAAMAALRFCRPEAVFYARDVGEAVFLSRLGMLPGRGIRLVFEMHEVLHEQAHNAVRKEHVWRKEQRVVDAAAGLVVTNPMLADMARELFGYARPVCVEPNGYSPEVFKPVPLFAPGNPWPQKEDVLRLVYLGRFHVGKGVENLVAAMEHLPARVHLRIIGGSPVSCFAELREQAKRIAGGEERITFTGALPQKEAAQACVGGHMFIVPQESGSSFFSPLKIYEALALGMPVLTTPVAEFAAHTKANLVSAAPGTSPRDLAEGILTLAADPGKAAMLRENGLAAAKSATWAARAKRILDFCRTLEQ